jgi:hypothetical protein
MSESIRIVVQHYETSTNKVLSEEVLREDGIRKPEALKELGYLHLEQIDLLSKIQDFKITHQIKLINNNQTCPKCNGRIRGQGRYKSSVHTIFTDHVVDIKRISCNCGCNLPYTIEGIFGSKTHPDLLKRQVELGSQQSYEKTSRELNYNSLTKRSINNHSNVHKAVKKVADILEKDKLETVELSTIPAKELIVNIDGGHVKARGETRSFEVMIASVYKPENIKIVDKNHKNITSKTIVGSAKNDEQETMKLLFKNACKKQGINKKTKVVCLADGAQNCWSIANSIKNECSEMLYILDWFHIGMKFKNNISAVAEENTELYDKVKWHLWHGNADKSIVELEKLWKQTCDDKSKDKLKKLLRYIKNNKDHIVNYERRMNNNLPYTSNVAESTVNNLINVRQKNKQRMTWSRDGSHNVLQIRSSIYSHTWDKDWSAIEPNIYKKAA